MTPRRSPHPPGPRPPPADGGLWVEGPRVEPPLEGPGPGRPVRGRTQLGSARFQRLLFEQSTMGLALCHLDGRLVDVNPAYATLLGRTVDETLALTYWDITPRDYEDEEQAQLASLRLTGKYGPYEKEYLRKDGSRVPVRLSGCLFPFEGDTLIWSSAEDISELRRAEGDLRRSESFNRTVLEASQDCIKVLSLEGILAWVNEGGAKALELCRPEDVVGRWWPDLWEGPDREQAKAAILAAARGTASQFQGHHRVPSGFREWWDVRVSPLPGPDGQPERILAVSRDITQEWRNAQLRADILDRVSDAFVALDKDWHYTYLNQQAAGLFGRRPEDLIGKHIWTEFPDGLGQPFHQHYERALRDQEPVTFEDYYAPWDRWFENRVFPSQGGLSIFFHEITERKRAEQALTRSQCLLTDTETMGKVGGWEFSLDSQALTWTDEVYRIHEVDSACDLTVDKALDFYTPESRPRIERAVQEAIEQGQAFDLDLEILTGRGHLRSVHAIGHADLERRRVHGFVQDITEQKRMEALLNGQKRVLELTASGTPLPETLAALVRLIESQSPGMLGSILLLDEDGLHVRHGAAPSLPAAFLAAVDGQPIGPCAGSCGTAAYRKEAVYVEDIASDPLWASYKAAALPHGLRACWSTPIFDGQGGVLGLFAMYYRQPGLPQPEHRQLIDIATHTAAIAIKGHRAEQALRQREQQLRFVSDHAPVMLAHCDASKRYVFVNQSYAEFFGQRPADLVGRPIRDILGEGPFAQAEPFMDRALSGRTTGYDFAIPAGPKGTRELAVHYAPEFDGAGSVVGFIAAVTEVTERLQAAALLAQRARQLEALNALSTGLSSTLELQDRAHAALEGILEALAPDLVLLFLKEGEELRLLEAISRPGGLHHLDAPSHRVGHCLCGLGAKEGRALYSADIQTDHRCTWAECKQAGVTSFAVLPLKRGGEVLGVLGLASATQRDFQQEAAFLETIAAQLATGLQNALLLAELQAQAVALEHRVEERTALLSEANQELGRAVERAQAADRTKSAFLSAMSHELRTPLNSVIGFTGVLLGGLAGELRPEQREPLEIVQRNGRHLLDLINDILDLSKIEAHEMRLAPGPLDLVQVAGEALEAIAPAARAKGLDLTRSFASASLSIPGDRRRVAQILLNLLANAVKFTDSGTVSLGLSVAGGIASAVVRDTGPGIAEGDLPRLFREFEQLDIGLGRRSEGTGLGLALSRRLARLMGGDIVVESRLGEGSAFTLILPLGVP